MRNSETVLKEITAWAGANPDVRAVMLTGSRGNRNNETDLLSDYDIEIAVENADQFLINEKWLSVFGDIITIIKVDKEFTLRMVLYSDYVRIDFRIYSIENFKYYLNQPQLPQHWDIGYIVLLDKDGLTKQLKPPSYKAFIIIKPSEEEFLTLVNDFWWDATYVAKSLRRNEVFYAKYMSDNIIRFSYLEKVIEWYVSMQHGWQITTNKYGRFFRTFLDSETWKELEQTFSGSDIEENWRSFFATIQLFRRLATTIAKELNYSYPCKLDVEMTAYLQKIRAIETI